MHEQQLLPEMRLILLFVQGFVARKTGKDIGDIV